jgi:hypothetical protein
MISCVLHRRATRIVGDHEFGFGPAGPLADGAPWNAVRGDSTQSIERRMFMVGHPPLDDLRRSPFVVILPRFPRHGSRPVRQVGKDTLRRWQTSDDLLSGSS